MAHNRKEIYGRIDKVILEVLKFIEIVPKTLVNIEICKQLVRSVMSIGANANEAEGAASRKDFIHCFSISKKEGKETSYWLMILGYHNIRLSTKAELLRKEIDEIVLIISSIILSTKRNSKK